MPTPRLSGQLLDDDLEYMHSNGELRHQDSRSSIRCRAASATTSRHRATIETVRIFGDVGVIRGKAKVTVADRTASSQDLHIGYTDIWLWKDGRWQMTAWRSRAPARFAGSSDSADSSDRMSHPRRKTLAVQRRPRDRRRRRAHRRPVDDQHRHRGHRRHRAADQGAGARRLASWCASPSTRHRAAAAVAPIRDRLAQMGVGVPIIGDFHFNGHKLLREHPECAEALAKYRINPGNVGRGSKRDPQFAEMIEFACRYEKPVRIGVNWGSLDQDLLTRMMDENNSRAAPLSAQEIMREAVVASALESAARAVGARAAARAHHPLARRSAACRISSPSTATSPSAATIRCISASPKPAWAARASSPPPPAWRCCCRKASATPSACRSRPNRTAIAPTKSSSRRKSCRPWDCVRSSRWWWRAPAAAAPRAPISRNSRSRSSRTSAIACRNGASPTKAWKT